MVAVIFGRMDEATLQVARRYRARDEALAREAARRGSAAPAHTCRATPVCGHAIDPTE